MKKGYFVFLILLLVLCLGISLISCNNNTANKPVFLGFYVEKTMIKNNSLNLGQFNSIDTNYLASTDSEIADSMYINYGEKMVIALQFINEKRDVFVDLVLDDSDYGEDQVYNNSSKINIVHSVETYKKDGNWITDVTIVMPKTKSHTGTREIQIKEVNFLKEMTNTNVQADLSSQSYSKNIKATITDKYVPTSKVFFEYEEVEYNGNVGLEITNIISEYGYPNVIYIPEKIDNVNVISCAENILPNQKIKGMILPSTFIYHHAGIMNDSVSDLFILLSHDVINIHPTNNDDSLVHFDTAGADVYVWSEYYNSHYSLGYDISSWGLNLHLLDNETPPII